MEVDIELPDIKDVGSGFAEVEGRCCSESDASGRGLGTKKI